MVMPWMQHGNVCSVIKGKMEEIRSGADGEVRNALRERHVKQLECWVRGSFFF